MKASLGTLKNRSPHGVKTLVSRVTRTYGIATAGMRPLPDFVIIGTKRGGTTSMWNWLVEHPGVLSLFPAVQAKKSTDYFFDGCAHGERWYRSHFYTGAYRGRQERRSGHRLVTGEASPLYMYDPRICDLVYQVMPQVKVIIQLRDPVGRALSHWQERTTQGVETLSFREALERESERTGGELERMLADPTYYSEAFDWFSYRDRGVYAPQVKRWFDRFPKEQILVVASEDFSRDEQATMNEVSEFLGVPAYQRARYSRHNLSPKIDMDADILADLTEFYAPHNAEVKAFLGRDFDWR